MKLKKLTALLLTILSIFAVAALAGCGGINDINMDKILDVSDQLEFTRIGEMYQVSWPEGKNLAMGDYADYGGYKMVIPDEYEGLPVKQVKSGTFLRGLSTRLHLVIGSNVESMHDALYPTGATDPKTLSNNQSVSPIAKITVSPENKNYAAEGGVLTSGTTVLRIATSVTDCVIPDGMTKMANYAFCGRNKFNSIIFPDSMESIGWVDRVTVTTALRFNDGLVSIAGTHLSGFFSSEGIYVPATTTSIGSYALAGQTIYMAHQDATGLNLGSLWWATSNEKELSTMPEHPRYFKTAEVYSTRVVWGHEA